MTQYLLIAGLVVICFLLVIIAWLLYQKNKVTGQLVTLTDQVRVQNEVLSSVEKAKAIDNTPVKPSDDVFLQG